MGRELALEEVTSDTRIEKTVGAEHTAWTDLLTRERWIEIGRIILTGVIVLLDWQEWIPAAGDKARQPPGRTQKPVQIFRHATSPCRPHICRMMPAYCG